MSIPVSVLLHRKGTVCHTIPPDALLSEVAQRLTQYSIGSLVVSRDGAGVDGIISERDVIAALAANGETALALPTSSVMSSPATTCTPETRVNELMSIMTDRRIRHLPVVDGGRLVGIVSIGDVVKWRIDELAEDAEHLQEYVAGTY